MKHFVDVSLVHQTENAIQQEHYSLYCIFHSHFEYVFHPARASNILDEKG